MATAHRGPPRSRHWAARVAPPAIAIALTAVALAGCGSGESGSSNGSGGNAQASAPMASEPMSGDSSMSAPTIHIGSFAYMTPMSVSPGSRVAVMNMDGEAHTVTADSGGAFDVNAPAGMTVTFTAPTTPGRYPFHCTFHASMHGVLVVK